MRKRVVLSIAGAVVAAASAVVITTGGSSGAATATSDLGITGSAIAGVTSIEGGTSHLVAFQFTLTNHGPASVTLDQNPQLYLKSVTGAELVDLYCVQAHAGGNGDGTFCETVNGLKVNQSVQEVITVRPTTNTAVTACYKGAISDPNPANNCLTLKVSVI